MSYYKRKRTLYFRPSRFLNEKKNLKNTKFKKSIANSFFSKLERVEILENFSS